MTSEADVAALTAAARARLPLTPDLVPDGYGHLALCVIDAVFSIGVNYGQVIQVVQRYAEHAGITDLGTRGRPAADEHTVDRLLDQYRRHGWERLMTDVFRNRTWTSPAGARLRKAAAVEQFAQVLDRYDVRSVGDVDTVPPEVKAEIRQIPGQRSGLSYFYFLMLAGADDHVKADRHIIAFVTEAIGHRPTQQQAADLVRRAARDLTDDHPWITPMALDYAMWRYQSGRP